MRALETGTLDEIRSTAREMLDALANDSDTIDRAVLERGVRKILNLTEHRDHV